MDFKEGVRLNVTATSLLLSRKRCSLHLGY